MVTILRDAGLSALLPAAATVEVVADGFQFTEDMPWFAGLHYRMGVDGISVLFVLLTAFLMPICILASWTSIQNRVLEYMVAFLVLTATSFCLFGFILGICAKSFEQLNFIPMLVITPLTFLGGAFYSIDLLPGGWRTFSLFNPVVYLINGFRWTFYGVSDVPVVASFAITAVFFGVCLAVVTWIFRTGYRLKT